MPIERLIFVYNADDGFFNALMDSAHKVFSSATYECSLCHFTYGLTGMLLPWKNFLDGLPLEKSFLRPREFRQHYPALNVPLPVILGEADGKAAVLLSADEIKAAGSLDGLTLALRARLDDTATPLPSG